METICKIVIVYQSDKGKIKQRIFDNVIYNSIVTSMNAISSMCHVDGSILRFTYGDEISIHRDVAIDFNKVKSFTVELKEVK